MKSLKQIASELGYTSVASIYSKMYGMHITLDSFDRKRSEDGKEYLYTEKGERAIKALCNTRRLMKKPADIPDDNMNNVESETTEVSDCETICHESEMDNVAEIVKRKITSVNNGGGQLNKRLEHIRCLSEMLVSYIDAYGRELEQEKVGLAS